MFLKHCRFQTAAEFLDIDPVLNADEAGLEEDTGKYKVGDGSTKWSELEYKGSTSGSQNKLSDKALAWAAHTNLVTLTAGSEPHTMVWDGATIQKGDSYWGVDGVAKDLELSVVEGALRMPAGYDDRQFSVGFKLQIIYDDEETGFAAVRVSGNNGATRQVITREYPGSDQYTSVEINFMDQFFKGDPAYSINVVVDPSHCTHDVGFGGMSVFVVEQ